MASIDDQIKSHINAAIACGSFKKVYEILMERFREENEFLKELLSKNTKENTVENKLPAPQTEKKPVKKAKTYTIENMDLSGNQVNEAQNQGQNENTSDENQKSADQNIDPSGNILQENTIENSEKIPNKKLDAKQKQKMKEEATLKRLELEGKKPMDMLTYENLKQWIEVENLSYAKIAADHVGCSEQVVAQVARSYGFKSSYSGKKGIIIGNK